MQLSKSFTLAEMTFSDTASRRNIDNTPNADQIKNLKLLCENVLQKIRDFYGKPVVVTSGFRSKKLNTALGGSSPTSQHMGNNGAAADFHVIGVSNQQVYNDIKTGKIPGLIYDQMIDEFNYQWVHISYKEINNRKQNLRAVKQNGKTVYITG